MTDGEGDSEGSEADGGYASALEDDGTQLAELARGLPPGGQWRTDIASAHHTSRGSGAVEAAAGLGGGPWTRGGVPIRARAQRPAGVRPMRPY